MEQFSWYATLVKPAWAPPAWLFGTVWTILYAIIFVSFGYVFYLWYKGIIPFLILLPFLLNLVTNALFTPLQFSLQSNLLAFVDIVLVLLTLGWALFVIYPIAPLVVYVNIPYFLWVAFATVLQGTITYLNW
jgi:benzodiazapine receptor